MYYYILDQGDLPLEKFEKLQTQLLGLLAEFKISGETARVTPNDPSRPSAMPIPASDIPCQTTSPITSPRCAPKSPPGAPTRRPGTSSRGC